MINWACGDRASVSRHLLLVSLRFCAGSVAAPFNFTVVFFLCLARRYMQQQTITAMRP